jgi:hypothetical protein
MNQAFLKMKPEPVPKEAKDALAMLVLLINKKQRMKLLAERFSTWKKIAWLMSIRRRKILEKLERLGLLYNMQNNRLKLKKMRESMFLWKQLLSDERLRKKFFSVLLRTTFGRLAKCYNKWSNLPDSRLQG